MPERFRLREGWSSALLLLALVLSMAMSFEAGGLAEGLRILPTVAVLGVLIGIVVAKTRLPGSLAHPLGIVAGAGSCFVLLGTILMLPLDVPMIGAPRFGMLAAAEVKWLLLLQHMGTWLGAIVHGEVSRDPVPFVVQMTALTWLLSFYGAWFVFRSHRVWAAVLPVGLITFVSVYYAPPRLLIYFVVCLLVGLLLVARANVYDREAEWQREHVLYEPHIGYDFLRASMQLSLFIIVLMWLVPRPDVDQMRQRSVEPFRTPWERVQQEWRRLYASLSYGGQQAAAPFGRAVMLGGGVSFGDAPVMEVDAASGHYWRALVLDRYTGKGWIDTSTGTLSLASDAPLVNPEELRACEVLTQTFRLLRAGETILYAATEPWKVSGATRVQAALPPEGEPAGKASLDVSAIYPPETGERPQYVARSLVSTATIRDLMQAGASYPVSVTQRYLQLPDPFPSRIHDLAIQVAGDKPTPYDQAQAIETYLRKLTYNQSIEAPPADGDPVEWFLFDYQQGYCTYFASAMVLMCRSLGIPARFAQGYAIGQYEAGKHAIVVRELDAHAWPEVYFPGYGWIQFEPTPSRPAIVRPGVRAAGALPAPTLLPSDADYNRRQKEQREHRLPPTDRLEDGESRSRPAAWRRLPWAGMLGGLMLVSAAVLLWWRLAPRWRALRPAERIYLRLTWAAAAAGVNSEPYQTPLEFGRAVGEALGPGRYHVARIVEVYVRERFAGGANEADLRAARFAWRRLRTMLPRQILRSRLRGKRR